MVAWTPESRRQRLADLLRDRGRHGFETACPCSFCHGVRTVPAVATDIARAKLRMLRFVAITSVVWAALGYGIARWTGANGEVRFLTTVLMASVFWTHAPRDVAVWWRARRFAKRPAAE